MAAVREWPGPAVKLRPEVKFRMARKLRPEAPRRRVRAEADRADSDGSAEREAVRKADFPGVDRRAPEPDCSRETAGRTFQN